MLIFGYFNSTKSSVSHFALLFCLYVFFISQILFLEMTTKLTKRKACQLTSLPPANNISTFITVYLIMKIQTVDFDSLHENGLR